MTSIKKQYPISQFANVTLLNNLIDCRVVHVMDVLSDESGNGFEPNSAAPFTFMEDFSISQQFVLVLI